VPSRFTARGDPLAVPEGHWAYPHLPWYLADGLDAIAADKGLPDGLAVLEKATGRGLADLAAAEREVMRQWYYDCYQWAGYPAGGGSGDVVCYASVGIFSHEAGWSGLTAVLRSPGPPAPAGEGRPELITICPETRREMHAVGALFARAGGPEQLFGGEPVQVVMVAAGAIAAHSAGYGGQGSASVHAGNGHGGGGGDPGDISPLADPPMEDLPASVIPPGSPVDWHAIAAALAGALEAGNTAAAEVALAAWRDAQARQRVR
jgi:hypothetical protein